MAVEPDFSRYQPTDQETLTIGNIAAGLTVAKASLALLTEIVCEVDSYRYWKSGANPTTAQGILVGPGERVYLWAVEIIGFRAIRVTGDATLQVTYYVRRTGLRPDQPVV